MNEQKTTVDWLRFRVQADPGDVVKALRPMFRQGRFAESKVTMIPMERGILGFRSGAGLFLEDMQLGRMDYGGETQKGWCRVDLPAKGCEWVNDWAALDGVEALTSAQIRRLDIALTTWRAEVTHERVLQAHHDGRFVTRGRPPHLRQITSSDPRAGRTCYIGKREQSDKFMRCYEKGFEMLGTWGRCTDQVAQIDGFNVEDIYRCEVELKAENVPIPWEVVERRDQYFAGAYPFCADVLPGVEADILQRRPERAPQMELAAALENCRIQFGPTIFTALSAYRGDMTAVWDKIIGDHHSADLLAAGALLVEHQD